MMGSGPGDERGIARRLGAAVPTRVGDWPLLARALRSVLTGPFYALLAAASGALALTLVVVSRNYDVLRDFVVFGELSVAARFEFMLDLYPFVGPVYSTVEGALLVGIATLIGVNVAMVAYRLVESTLVAREGADGVAGAALGTLGAGCAACGTAVIGGALGAVGVGGGLAALPYGGLELLTAAVAVLALSTYALARAIASDEACPIGHP